MASASDDTPRLTGFSRALDRLEEALAEPPSAIVRDASIQRFEFAFELAWKAIQERLRNEGQPCPSPKACLRAGFRQGWIDDETAALALLDDRNLTSHTYDEALAQAVYERLPDHLLFLRRLQQRLSDRDIER